MEYLKRSGEVFEDPVEDIKDQRIEDLRRPIQEVILQLKDKIDKGEYDYIVGDDASGRVPVLVFSTFLKKVYEEKGFDLPQTFFFAGGTPTDVSVRDWKLSEIKSTVGDFLESRPRSSSDNRVLLMTDYVLHGNSLKTLCDALKELEIKYDIATLAASFDNNSDDLEKMLGAQIYEGGINDVPSIYNRPDLAGVVKRSNDKKIFSSPIGNEEQSKINSARKDANALAEQIFKWYKTTRQSPRVK